MGILYSVIANKHVQHAAFMFINVLIHFLPHKEYARFKMKSLHLISIITVSFVKTHKTHNNFQQYMPATPYLFIFNCKVDLVFTRVLLCHLFVELEGILETYCGHLLLQFYFYRREL